MPDTPANDLHRLQNLLGGSRLSDLRRRLRRRFDGRIVDTAPFTLSGLSNVERDALSGLLGLPHRRADSLRIDPVVLDAVLQRAGLAGSLRCALEMLDGPIIDRQAELSALQLRWQSTIANAAHPRLRAFLQTPTGLADLKRWARLDTDVATRLIAQAQRVLAQLPAAGIPRSQLAADSVGDAHALDRGRPLTNLVLACTAQPDPTPPSGIVDAMHRRRALPPYEHERDHWADVGVLVNELARPALVLNLPCDVDTPVGRQLVHAGGEPVYLSLRSLLRNPSRWPVHELPVYVCENPNVVAIAADHLGVHCAALVCTDGMPAAAQRALLQQLHAAGARLHYHGDFDWPGLRIANHVLRRFSAVAWRMGTADFDQATCSGIAQGRGLTLSDPIQADWDENLADAMRAFGHAIDEEAVVQTLLSDLDLRLGPGS